VLPEDVHLADGSTVEVHLTSVPGQVHEPEDLEERFLERLLEAGLVSEIRPLLRLPPTGDRKPLQVPGRPLSESILEERR
jgi:hypothetical protein